MGPTTRVFVSYSHESEQHRSWVLALADRLRADGVDAWIDRYAPAPVEGWPRWIRRQIEESDFVLCVCTPAYRRAFDGHPDPERGLGVNNEGFIILQDLYDRGNVSERYIPVLPGNTWSWADVPSALRGFTRYRLPEDYEDLRRRLARSAGEPPPLGARPERVPALAPVSPNGYEAQALVAGYLRPDDYPLERLAPTEGLFLSRLINPVDPFDPTIVMTVWLAARGDTQYIVDSARVYNEWRGGAGPLAGVALAPDAAYHFTFHDGSDREHALDPALSVGPQTRRIASFTVSATPDQPLYGLARLWIWVRYHTSDGRRGSLVLSQPPESGLVLAKLLGREVAVGTEAGPHVVARLVTPDGLQRGLEEGYEPELRLTVFDEMAYDYVPRHRATLLDLRARCREEMARRQVLNRELAAANAYPVLATHLADGKWWAADVLGGMADEPATAVLLARLAEQPGDRWAFNGLCVRHLAQPDDVLPGVVRDADRDAHWDMSEAATVLLVAPVDPWVSADPAPGQAGPPAPADDWIAALDRLTAGWELKWSAVPALLHGDLSPRRWRQVVDRAGGPLGRGLHVRGGMHGWASPPPDETRLEHGGDDRYRATVRLAPGVHQFKIADKDWSAGRNWGGREPGGTVVPGEPYPLFCDDLSQNLTLDLSGEGDTRPYVFEVDAADPARPTVRVGPG
ncbi:MAG TPA: SEFIR domain-containing protein [Pilimelia sp.]|nr:SEFIR domain-containing protein [Pilimelia sp.]